MDRDAAFSADSTIVRTVQVRKSCQAMAKHKLRVVSSSAIAATDVVFEIVRHNE